MAFCLITSHFEDEFSRQSTALVLATKNNETKSCIDPKHCKQAQNSTFQPVLANTKKLKPRFGTPSTTSGQETERVLFLNPCTLHGPYVREMDHTYSIALAAYMCNSHYILILKDVKDLPVSAACFIRSVSL